MAAQGKRRTIVARDPWRELEELQELIVNPEDIGEPLANPEFPDRKLLHKGVLSRILPTQVVEDGVILLLSDLLIYCLEDSHGLLTVDGVIEITPGASCKMALGADGVMLVLNVLSEEQYGYTFVVQTAQEQQFWFNTIMQAIEPGFVGRNPPPQAQAAAAARKSIVPAPVPVDDDQYSQEEGGDYQSQSEYSSRPQSRQSVRTYEQDLSVPSDDHAASGDYGAADDDPDEVDSHDSRPHSRNSFRNGSASGRSTPDVGALKLADKRLPLSASARDFVGGSRSSSRAGSHSDYKSPDSFLSQRSVSTFHPQDSANEDAVMGQVAALPNLLQIRQIAEALSKRTIEQRLLMMSKPEGCVMIKFNVSNGNPVARKVRLSADRESIEWCKVDGFIERWSSHLWIKDIAALRFAPALDTKVYKHGSCADYLIFACILLQGSRMYCKAPRRYQIKAENAKIGIADVPLESNPVMEVPALVFAARRGIDVLDWYLGLQHLIQMKGMSDTDVTREEIILRVASEDPASIVHQRETEVYLKGKILEHMKETRKKEIIVERFEAKLKEESEMLAMEAQRANEMRQRQRGQRSKVSSRSRGAVPSSRDDTQYRRRTTSVGVDDDYAPVNRRSASSRGNTGVPMLSNIGGASSSSRRRQSVEDEEQDDYGVGGSRGGRAQVNSSSRRRVSREEEEMEEEEEEEDYRRGAAVGSGSRSRPVSVRDDIDDEYDAAPSGRRGGRGGGGRMNGEYQSSGSAERSGPAARSRRGQA